MTISDDKLSAYIDGELSPSEINEIKLALKNDPAVGARMERLKRPDALISAAYGKIDDEPMPDSVMDLLRDTGDAENSGEKVIQFAPRPAAKSPALWAVPLAASIALAIGVGVGMQIAADHSRNENQFALAGVIDSSSPVFAALESTPSATMVETPDGTITPILTFKSENGDYCREYVVANDAVTNRAVACRHEGQWVTQFAALAPPNSAMPNEYSTASVEITTQFNNLIESMMADEALNSEEEGSLLERWLADR